MKTIKDIDISKKRILIRVDFNVPLNKDHTVADDSRIRAVLPTFEYILKNNAKMIIASHLGRPKGKKVAEFSLSPAAAHLEKILGKPVKMAPDCIGDEVNEIIADMTDKEIVLLENLRFHPEEEKNDEAFARQLGSLCDIYVNDAFAVSHRAHASVHAVTRFAPVSVAGLLLKNEIDYYEKAVKNPERPLVAVIGGAKVSGKLEALNNMVNQVDKFIIGGAMANTFLKSTGIDVGKSKVEDDLVGEAQSIMKKAAEKGVQFYLPVDGVAADRFEPDASTKTAPIQEIPEDWMILDIGPASSVLFSEVLADAKTIVWNGPMGAFEMDAFNTGTYAMAKTLAQSDALTIIGGGDTDAAVHRSGYAEKMSYISTGGGAFLTLLEGKKLPGVQALEE